MAGRFSRTSGGSHCRKEVRRAPEAVALVAGPRARACFGAERSRCCLRPARGLLQPDAFPSSSRTCSTRAPIRGRQRSRSGLSTAAVAEARGSRLRPGFRPKRPSGLFEPFARAAGRVSHGAPGCRSRRSSRGMGATHRDLQRRRGARSRKPQPGGPMGILILVGRRAAVASCSRNLSHSVHAVDDGRLPAGRRSAGRRVSRWPSSVRDDPGADGLR